MDQNEAKPAFAPGSLDELRSKLTSAHVQAVNTITQNDKGTWLALLPQEPQTIPEAVLMLECIQAWDQGHLHANGKSVLPTELRDALAATIAGSTKLHTTLCADCGVPKDECNCKTVGTVVTDEIDDDEDDDGDGEEDGAVIDDEEEDYEAFLDDEDEDGFVDFGNDEEFDEDDD